MRIRDPGWKKFGSGMEKSDPDRDNGSATLHAGKHNSEQEQNLGSKREQQNFHDEKHV